MASESLEGKFDLAPFGTHATKRLVVPEAEKVLFTPYPCLDQGFVRLVDYMGGDDSVVRAARVSYGGGTKTVSDNAGLIRYLMRHRHTTPSEMVELTFHAKMPILVARQWVRHRTASINEISARYSVLDKEFYTPDPDVLGVQARNNKQGRDESVSLEQAEAIISLLKRDAAQAYESYEFLLNESSQKGSDGRSLPEDPTRPMLARELARMNLPVSIYTQWYWKVNLHNLFHFLGLRKDPHAQHEIRVYADAMADIASKVAPESYRAFEDYVLDGITLSKLDRQVIVSVTKGASPEDAAGFITNKRERQEAIEKVKKILELS